MSDKGLNKKLKGNKKEEFSRVNLLYVKMEI